MAAMNLREILCDEILPAVTKPSRYLGTEFNSVHKNPEAVELRVALAFPDLYDMGLGNLGLLILYAILNDLPWCWAERAYAPAPDMEAALRGRGLPLFATESKDPLGDMDLIGFTLQSELTYTNVLTMLDLAGIPLRAAGRDDRHPIIAAGGPTAFNPEPMAPFIDCFVIGDGEDAIVEIAEVLRGLRGRRRDEKLEALVALPGVYVPGRFPVETLPDGRVLPDAGAPKIVRRIAPALDEAAFPTEYIVPFAQQIHERVGIEVLRGCTRGCRFCQAGMVTRPVRERSVDAVDRLMQQTLGQTGYEEVGLLSLSTCDHSEVGELVRRAAARAAPARASVSLPSLRLDAFSLDLAELVTGIRRSGLTFAPEAATPRLRGVINKWIADEQLIDVAREAFRRGWGHIKTYFMIGLPTERDEDVEAIVDLCRRVLEAGRAVNPKARLHTGVATFVPKPFTPFQWAAQISFEEARRRQAILEHGFRRIPGVKFGRHAPKATMIEGLLARGHRRAADLIEAAWRRGARFESWDEELNWDAWLGAIQDTGYDVDDALRERRLDERLPWDHIDILISKQWLREEWHRAMRGEAIGDCRHGTCNGCGVSGRAPELCERMWDRYGSAGATEGHQNAKDTAEVEPPAPVQRLRFRIGRRGEIRFLSHLESASAWIRALRRAQAPLAYSQGFHAHPKVAFATASPVGEESTADYMDVTLTKRVDPGAFLGRLQAALPRGLEAFEVDEVPLGAPALMAVTTGFAYTLRAQGDRTQMRDRVERLLDAREVWVERKVKAKNRKGRRGPPQKARLNIRPMIADVALCDGTTDELVMDVRLQAVDGKSAKPREVAEALGLDPLATRVVKKATYFQQSRDEKRASAAE
ncbi:MAG: TIGR03960 family B12-binding radical SAM protein [Candidatus Hydrogenedentes bacterium]|nr:TIGR03960 family B12-binding radical SAM protein [Candidatus Hydrogenedentota bacterium]